MQSRLQRQPRLQVKVQMQYMMLRALVDDAKPEVITTVIHMGKRTGYSLILRPLSSVLCCFVFRHS
jgi:predicted Zn-ribbon and HTH transcriptional regulator